MALPVPDLDDRRFQDLVDDAKRMVQQRCPEWSDHNVSDPGVTLIETFAFMVDQLLYRLNRVPDRLYTTFLELVGVSLYPACAASADLTFWLSAPLPEPVTVPQATEVASLRGPEDDAVVFATTGPLALAPRRLAHLATQALGGEPVLRADELREDRPFPVFSDPPVPGDVLLVGLDEAAPALAVGLTLECRVQGRGVDPRYPPLVWEAWNGTGWTACEVERDGTGGLNRPGEVVVHVSSRHVASVLGRQRAGWLRCRVVEPEPGFPAYSAAPLVQAASAATVGGTVRGEHAETVHDEVLGLSEGVPGQVFVLARHPVVAGGPPLVVEVAGGSGWRRWKEVDSFGGRGPDERVVRIDRVTGEVAFPPAVREQDGTLRTYGAVPPKGAPLRVPEYRTGGGPAGNVAARALRVLRTTVPFVDRVENRRPAVGGVAGESVDQARQRGPLALRTRDRAVTAEDYEHLARQAVPGLARVRCVPAREPEDAGGVRLLVVPSAAPGEDGRLRFEDLVPSDEVLETVTRHLDERRVVGSRLLVEPPSYQGVTVVARITAREGVRAEDLRADAVEALYGYLDPLSGGPDRAGWPFGRPVQSGEVHAVLQQLPGTDVVDDVRLFAANPLTGERGEPVQRIDLDRQALVFSFGHQVRAAQGE
ncbi:MAG: Baseplate family protein [Frankiales bacterium]|nr:Baseplate family protein [Frankiales bacterium]